MWINLVQKNFLELKENVEESKFNFAEFKTMYFFPSNRGGTS